MSERKSRTVPTRSSSAAQIAQAYRTAHEVISAAMSMVVLVGIGYWLDLKSGWSPVLTVFGACLGFIAAAASLKVLLQRLDRESKVKHSKPSGGGEKKSE